MKHLVVILLLLLLNVSAAVAQDDGCPTLPTRLAIGDTAQVTPGLANRLRTEPSTSAAQTGAVPAEFAVTVLDGPVCANGVLWWQVAYQGETGWTAEIVGDSYALVPMAQRAFGGVQFALPDLYDEQHFVGELVAEKISESIMPISHPEYIRFGFGEDIFGAGLHIYPLAAYGQIEPYVAETIFWLQELLTDRPPLEGMNELPYVLRLGAAQMLVARPTYVEGTNISGIHYLTHFAQAFFPLERDSLVYTFQGITRDGLHLVSLTVPVTVDVLPETAEPLEYNNVEDEFETVGRYVRYIKDLLGNAEPSSIQPTMESLSQIALTLKIEPGTLMTGQDTLPSVDLPLVIGTACERTDFPPRLQIGNGARQALPDNITALPTRVPGGEEIGWPINSGGIVGVMDGPVCMDGLNHWFVYDFRAGYSGWIAESDVFYQDSAERYFFEPVDAALDVPQIPDSGCSLLSFFNARVYDQPNVHAPLVGRLVGGTLYPADALLTRAEGGYLWWRLPSGLVYLREGNQEVMNEVTWVPVDIVFATPDCQYIERVDVAERGADLEFQGIHVTLPDFIAPAQIVPVSVPASVGDEWVPGRAELVELVLNGDYPLLSIYPLGAFMEADSAAAGAVAWLRQILGERPDLTSFTCLPFLIYPGSRQDLAVRAHYVDGDQLSGIAYLTHFTQQFQPYARDDLMYTFQGIYQDYFVSLTLPVSVSALPENPTPVHI